MEDMIVNSKMNTNIIIEKFEKNLLKIINISVTLLLIMMFVTVIMEVFFRYVVKKPVFGLEELSRYSMFYMTMIGSASAFKEKKHPALFFIIERFPAKYLQKWNSFLDFINIVILIFIFKEGYMIAVKGIIMKTAALRISYFWVYLALPIGALLMISQIIANRIIEAKSFEAKEKNLYQVDSGERGKH